MLVKWAGKEYNVDNLDDGDTVMDLKLKIMEQTGVRPERQKLLNLRVKGKAATDDMKVAGLGLKDNFKLMMMGSLEETIIETQTKPENLPEVINDLDIEEDEDEVAGLDVNLKDDIGLTQLHYAAEYNNLALTMFLLENGADVNIQDFSGVSPLHFSANHNHTEVVKILLEA